MPISNCFDVLGARVIRVFAGLALCAMPATGFAAQAELAVVGPDGYCIDETARQERAAGSFVLLGICSGLGQEGGPAPEQAAVLTALVSAPTDPPQRPTPVQMNRFFQTERGKAALAYDGDPGQVEILRSITVGDVLYLKVHDKSTGRPADLEANSWRAVFPLMDRLIALSATGHVGYPIGDDEAQATLRAFVEAMIAENSPSRPQLRPSNRPQQRPNKS